MLRYFGPENEFFIFDDVKISDADNHQMFKVESDEGHWADSRDYGDVGNMGHRPRIKGGYFPVMPTDSMVDFRSWNYAGFLWKGIVWGNLEGLRFP